MSKNTKIITARVPNEIYGKVERLSEGMTKSEFIGKAIRAYDDINVVCMWGDITVEILCNELKEKFMNGDISFSDGKIKWNN